MSLSLQATLMKEDSLLSKVFDGDPIPPLAKGYILAVLGAGFPILFYSIYYSVIHPDPKWLLLAALTICSSLFPVKIPLAAGKTQSLSISMGDIFVFLGIFLFGPAVAVTIAALEGITINARANIKRGYKKLFNMMQLVLVTFVVAHFFYVLDGRPSPLDPAKPGDPTQLLIQAGLCGLLYFALNSGILAFAMSLVTGQRLLDLWKENFVWASLTHLAGASLSIVVFLNFDNIRFYVVAVVIPIGLLIYYAYKINLGRSEQAQRHLEETNALLQQKIEAEKELQRAKDELEIRVQERTTELVTANQQLRVEIEERQQAETALAAETERLAVTVGSIGDGLIATDMVGRVVLINRLAEDLTGWSESKAVGLPLVEVFQITDRKSGERCEDPWATVLLTGQGTTVDSKEITLVSRDGTKRSISHSASPIRQKNGEVAGVVLVFRDITQQQKIEEELIEAQKLESLGVLAGGIAHDFNNILSGILLKTQLAQRATTKGKDPGQFLGSIVEATEMATNLTQQLLTFAKGGRPIKETTFIRNLLMDCASFALRGTNTRCRYEIAGDLWAVAVDKGQIGQVINNLVINAVQAMPSGGTITLSASNVEMRAENVQGINLSEGEYVRVSVRDEGEGIPAENLARLFDPYFSTKPKGHGLGLTTTRSIIEKHGGQITVESEPQKGSTFTFYLRASAEPVAQRFQEEIVTEHKGGRVLIMDDDQVIRDSLGELLEDLGYEADFAVDGAEAIAAYKEARATGNHFDVIFMDLTIPGGIGGKEAIRTLRTLDPDVNVIVSSGYSDDPVMSDYKQHGFNAVLVKPFTVEKLSRVLTEVFEAT